MDISPGVNAAVSAGRSLANQIVEGSQNRQASVAGIGQSVGRSVGDVYKAQREKEASAQFEQMLTENLGVPAGLARHVMASGNLQAINALTMQAIGAKQAAARRAAAMGGGASSAGPTDNPLSPNPGATSLAPGATPPAAPSAGGPGVTSDPTMNAGGVATASYPPVGGPATQGPTGGFNLWDTPDAAEDDVRHARHAAERDDNNAFARGGFKSESDLLAAQDQKRADIRAAEEKAVHERTLKEKAAEAKAWGTGMDTETANPAAIVPGLPGGTIPVVNPQRRYANAGGTDPEGFDQGLSRRIRAGQPRGGAPKEYVSPEIAKAAFDEAGQGHMYDPAARYTTRQLPKKPTPKDTVPDDVADSMATAIGIAPEILRGKPLAVVNALVQAKIAGNASAFNALLRPLVVQKAQTEIAEHESPEEKDAQKTYEQLLAINRGGDPRKIALYTGASGQKGQPALAADLAAAKAAVDAAKAKRGGGAPGPADAPPPAPKSSPPGENGMTKTSTGVVTEPPAPPPPKAEPRAVAPPPSAPVVPPPAAPTTAPTTPPAGAPTSTSGPDAPNGDEWTVIKANPAAAAAWAKWTPAQRAAFLAELRKPK